MIDERYARITCSCGAEFQVLKTWTDENGEELIDWNEEETATLYNNHIKICK